VLALLKTESVNLIAHPLWTVQETYSEVIERISSLQGYTKEKATKDFIDFLSIISSKDIQVFSDSSKSKSIDSAIEEGSITY